MKKDTAKHFDQTFLKFVIPIAILVTLAALSMPVSAHECDCGYETKYNGTFNGSIYFEVSEDWGDPKQHSMEETFAVPAGTIKFAKVYTGVWQASPGHGGKFSIDINGDTKVRNKAVCDPCSSAPCVDYQSARCDIIDETNLHDYITGCGVQFISYNATNDINAGLSNTVTVTIDKKNPCPEWDRIYTIALLVVYENTSSEPNMTFWVNEGAQYMDTDSSCCYAGAKFDNMSIYFNGTAPSINMVKYWTFGFPNVANAPTMELNENDIGQPDQVESRDGYDVLNKWDSISSNYINTGSDASNHFYYNDTGASYERVYVSVLKLTNETGRDLTVTDVDVGTPRPDTASTVKATIKNMGNQNAGAFNVSLYVNGSYNAKNTSITGLNAGSSTTVSFPSVTLPKGCHSFRVFADCDNNTAELNEKNNNRTVTRQVGYVIVVESYHDFDDLVTESNNNYLGDGDVSHSGDTYYIKDFTGSSAIVNCAGDGITIKNLNATTKFEIKNCTIENCTCSGVFLHNLSNGTIKNSTVQNNTLYGIEVGKVSLGSDDPDHVNITNNTIEGNYYGIELIGFNCTVKDNTIKNNTDLGIYVYGNYSNITDNVIQNNTNHGVKLFDSYNNYIYENEFIDNYVDAANRTSQGWDNKDNYWNTTELSKNYTGNRWSDWINNSGFPCNYTIDGGDAVDKRPKGLYDFLTGAGTDKWAYKPEVATKTPATCDVPSTEFSSYTAISVDDDTSYETDTAADNNYAAHRFNFSISESPNDISKINVTWNGKASNDDGHGATLYIWNGTAYEQPPLATTNSDDWVYLTGEVTSSISSYINSGNVTVLVVQNAKTSDDNETTSQIETDYVRVAITL